MGGRFLHPSDTEIKMSLFCFLQATAIAPTVWLSVLISSGELMKCTVPLCAVMLSQVVASYCSLVVKR